MDCISLLLCRLQNTTLEPVKGTGLSKVVQYVSENSTNLAMGIFQIKGAIRLEQQETL